MFDVLVAGVLCITEYMGKTSSHKPFLISLSENHNGDVLRFDISVLTNFSLLRVEYNWPGDG